MSNLIIASFIREDGECGTGNEYVVLLDASDFPESESKTRRSIVEGYSRRGFVLYAVVMAEADENVDMLPIDRELEA